MAKHRVERDTMGEVRIPADALWGPQTQRAVENFAISGQPMPHEFISALGLIKAACAAANLTLDVVDAEIAHVIEAAALEVAKGKWDDQFPIDVFQTGSGTSTNMNANEVIARRAVQLSEGKLKIHPNDHVNAGQSSNDVIPTAIHVALTLALRDKLYPALDHLYELLQQKANAFDHIVKTGRTHLQDATPIRMGQVIGGYAAQVDASQERVERAIEILHEVPIGGTAVGTGLNTSKAFIDYVIFNLNDALETEFTETLNHAAANASRDPLVEVSGQLKAIAVSLHKIANDIRFLASGPRSGLGELNLPPVQPGSSIMPGKINPVIAEALIMACAQVIGYDTANTLGGLGSYFELNLMMPLLAYNLLNQVKLLANSAQVFADRCVTGITVNENVCHASVERNLTLATALAPVIGYEKAADIAKQAQKSNRTVREVAIECDLMPEKKLNDILDPRRMTEMTPSEEDEVQTWLNDPVVLNALDRLDDFDEFDEVHELHEDW